MSIISQFTPNSNLREVLISLKYAFLPFLINNSDRHTKKLEQAINQYFPEHKVFTFDSGRTALYQVLQSYLNLDKDLESKEIIVAGHTCLVVVNAIQKAGLKPIYVDFQKDSFRVDTKDLQKKITKNTKFILLQHTFGYPEELEEISLIAKKNNITMIEDLAHSFTGKYNNQYLGSYSDSAILSFGSNKILSCLRGGAAITSNQDLAQELVKNHQNIEDFPETESYRYHLKHIIFYISQKFYFFFKLGKVIMWGASKLRLIPKVISFREKQSLVKFIPSYKISDSLSHIALKQFQNLPQNTANRQELAQLYIDNLQDIPEVKINPIKPDETHLFLPIIVPNPESLVSVLARYKVLLNLDWTGSPISPNMKSLSKYNYSPKNCPNSFEQAKHLVCLPLHQAMTEKKVIKITQLIRKYYDAHRSQK